MTGSQLGAPQPQTVSIFTSEAAARDARQRLLAADFSAEQVYLETRPIGSDNPIEGTKAGSGFKGGALGGGLLGGVAGLLFALTAVKFSAVQLVRNSDIALWFLGLGGVGGIVGAIAIGLMGGLSGAAAPKKSPSSSGFPLAEKQYLLVVRGNREQYQRASEVLQRT
ncbi:MAG: hypothetical protein SW833_22220 [Cyanobacteriota bacterium]|nr:hypothetical protein [Cyanobacteriota bacterium]